MVSYSNLSIRHKLLLMTLSVCGIALTTVSVVYIVGSIIVYGKNHIQDLRSLANTVGYNTRAAIVFQDREGVAAILAGLAQRRDIKSAIVFDKPGNVFGYYDNGRTLTETMSANLDHEINIEEIFEGQEGYNIDLLKGRVHTYAPVRLDSEIIGAIVIESKFSSVYAIVLTNIVIAIFAILICIPIVFILANRIQMAISSPILNLLGTMKLIAKERNYSVRAKKFKNDELGKLTDGFNEMLAQIKTGQDEVLEARLDAEAARRAKDERTRFLASMSHEIRTPINGVIGLANLLESTILNEKQRIYVSNINRSGKVLLSVVNDILDFSKIEAGKLELDLDFFDISYLIENVVAIFSDAARAKKLDLIYSISGSIDTRLLGDENRISQVLINMVGNAIKFTEIGGIEVRVGVMEDSEKSSRVRFEVLDTGIGIEEEKQKGIFDPFSQSDGSTTRRYGGTGLGLAISKQLVELMAGEVGFESNLGRGSRFWFEVRVEKDSEKISPMTALGGLKLLVVSKSQTASRILVERLGRWDVTCSGAENPRAALELIKSSSDAQRADLIVLDFGLGDWRSQGELRCIKELAKDNTIIALGHEPDFMAQEDLGFDSFLLKPILHSSLYKEVGKLTGRSVVNAADGMTEPSRNRQSLPFEGATILVAEDNPVNQLVVIGALEALGCKVLIAEDGRVALNMLMHGSFDLVLMDCFMPEMDGFEVTREFRRWAENRKCERIPIVALTANAMKGDRDLCLASGMDDYLSKPFSNEQLTAVLKRWLPVFSEHSDRRTEAEAGNFKEERITSRLFSIWNEMRKDQPVPLREEFELDLFPELREHFFVIELADNAPVFRYLGGALRDGMARELVDRPIADAPAGSMIGWVSENFNEVARKRRPVSYEFNFIDKQNCETKARSIMVPFSTDGSSIDTVMGVISFKREQLSLESLERPTETRSERNRGRLQPGDQRVVTCSSSVM